MIILNYDAVRCFKVAQRKWNYLRTGTDESVKNKVVHVYNSTYVQTGSKQKQTFPGKLKNHIA